jgi:hypothetical protein
LLSGISIIQGSYLNLIGLQSSVLVLKHMIANGYKIRGGGYDMTRERKYISANHLFHKM